MKRKSYRRKNPKWCMFKLGLCHDWANKEDEECKECEYNERNRPSEIC